jgi:HlyD family secretion protein
VAATKSSVARKLIPLVVVAILVIGALLYLRKEREPRELVLAGTLEARTVNVGSLAGGRIVRVLVDEGSQVVAGQVVAIIETDTIDRSIAEQQAAIAAANAQLKKALAGARPEEIAKAQAIAANDERDRRRFESLYHSGIASRDQYEDAATRAKERPLDSLMKQRAETEVKSSVTGIVQSFGLRPGDLVAPDQTVAEILEANQLWVRIFVPETLLGLVRVNQPVRVQVDTFANESFAGRIANISSQGEYTPRNVQTKAQRAEQVFGVKVVVDPNPKLKAGMAATVDLGVKGSSGS